MARPAFHELPVARVDEDAMGGDQSPAQETGPTGLRPVVSVTLTQRWYRYPGWTASPQDPERTCHLHMPAM